MRTKVTASQPQHRISFELAYRWFLRWPSVCGGKFSKGEQLQRSGETGWEKVSQGSPKESGGWEQRFHSTPDLGGHKTGRGAIPKVSEGILGQASKISQVSTIRMADYFRVHPRVTWGLAHCQH